MLIAGIVIVVLGISDVAGATLLARRQAASTGGLGAEPSPAATILRRAGVATIVVGLVLVAIGLAY